MQEIKDRPASADIFLPTIFLPDSSFQSNFVLQSFCMALKCLGKGKFMQLE